MNQPRSLEQQIKGIQAFDDKLVPGGPVKGLMKGVGATSRDLWFVKPEDIYVMPGLNPRVHDAMYAEGIQELAEDMVANGFYPDKPLTGFVATIDGKDRIVLGDGHRRHEAVQLAKQLGAAIDTVPLVLKDRSQMSMEDLTKSMLKSNEGKPFTVYEKAIIAKRFKSYGWEDTKIAQEMRVTPAFVGQILTLASAPVDIQRMVKEGVISATHAIETIKAKGEAAEGVLKEAVEKAKGKGKSRATAKDTSENARKRRAKNIGYEFYSAVVLLFADKKTMQVIDRAVYEELDRLVTEVENGKKRKERAPKESKPKGEREATSLAKKIGMNDRKVRKAEAPAAGKKLPAWDLALQQAKEAREGHPAARGERRS